MNLALAVVMTLAAAAPAHRDDDFERLQRSRLQAISAQAVAPFDAATKALDAQRTEEAVAGFRSVIAMAPDFDTAHRRLCTALGRLERVRRGAGGMRSCRSPRRFRGEPDGPAEGARRARKRRRCSPHSLGPSQTARDAARRVGRVERRKAARMYLSREPRRRRRPRVQRRIPQGRADVSGGQLARDRKRRQQG